MRTRCYDTDLNDAAWAWIAPYLPAARQGGRPRTTDLRAVLNAIFYLLRTGCQWRLLPREFPRPGTVYHYFSAWKDVGVLAELQRALHEQARLKPRPLALPFGGHPGQSVGQDHRARGAPVVSMGTNGSKGANATCSWTPWGWWWPGGSKPQMCRTDAWGRGCLPAYNPASRGSGR
jgi:putative transposase